METDKIIEEKEWFKIKRYPHIGFRLKPDDKSKWVEEYVKNPNKIKTHSFLPFIHRTYKVRRFRKKYSDKDGSLIVKGDYKSKVRNPDTKERELFYASHLDSMIYNYYSNLLLQKYEERIEEYNLGDVVTAYRSIPKENHNSNKCNIDFACDIFNLIKSNDSDHFVVIAFDIKGFFDNLKHDLIKKTWIDLYGNSEGKLPEDHYNVFKNITRYSYVNLVDIFNCFNDQIYVETSERLIKQKHISKIKYLKKEKATSFCSKKDFLKVKGKLIKKTKLIKNTNIIRDIGIPQGSPISSVIANLYLLDFDKTINNYLSKIDGVYRRYSDDMVVICPLSEKNNVLNLMKINISKHYLELQDKKTQVFHFQKSSDGKLTCGQEFLETGIINNNKKFVYLGLEFDGENILLKSGSISSYYRKMKRTIKRAKHYAHNCENLPDEIFRRRIFKRFSYKGKNRKRKWIYNKLLERYEPSNQYNWGNYLTYVSKANAVVGNNAINNQLKNHWKILCKELDEIPYKVFKEKRVLLIHNSHRTIFLRNKYTNIKNEFIKDFLYRVSYSLGIINLLFYPNINSICNYGNIEILINEDKTLINIELEKILRANNCKYKISDSILNKIVKIYKKNSYKLILDKIHNLLIKELSFYYFDNNYESILDLLISLLKDPKSFYINNNITNKNVELNTIIIKESYYDSNFKYISQEGFCRYIFRSINGFKAKRKIIIYQDVMFSKNEKELLDIIFGAENVHCIPKKYFKNKFLKRSTD